VAKYHRYYQQTTIDEDRMLEECSGNGYSYNHERRHREFRKDSDNDTLDQEVVQLYKDREMLCGWVFSEP
jgi:hypothetical protein